MSRNNDKIYNVTNCRSDIQNTEIFKNTYKCANIEDHLAKLEYRYQINTRLYLPHKTNTQSGLNREKKCSIRVEEDQARRVEGSSIYIDRSSTASTNCRMRTKLKLKIQEKKKKI